MPRALLTITSPVDGRPCLVLYDDGMVLSPGPADRDDAMALLAEAMKLVAGTPNRPGAPRIKPGQPPQQVQEGSPYRPLGMKLDVRGQNLGVSTINRPAGLGPAPIDPPADRPLPSAPFPGLML